MIDFEMMGMYKELFQALDKQAKKVIMHIWLLSRILARLVKGNKGMTPEQVAGLLDYEEARYKTFLSDGKTIHPGATAKLFQQEITDPDTGEPILDLFIKAERPVHPKPYQIYTEINGYYMTKAQIKMHEFIYAVRLVSKQLEGPLGTGKKNQYNINLYEEVIGICIHPNSCEVNKEKIIRDFIGREDILKEGSEEVTDGKVADLNLAERYHIFLYDPSEEDLEIMTYWEEIAANYNQNAKDAQMVRTYKKLYEKEKETHKANMAEKESQLAAYKADTEATIAEL